MSTRNIILKLDIESGVLTKLIDTNPIKENQFGDIYWLYAPYGTNVAKIKFFPQQFFDLTGVNPIPSLKMFQQTDEEVLTAIIPEGDVESGWSLFYYPIGLGISGILKSNRATQYDVSFQELEVDNTDEDYIGEYATVSTVDATVSTELDSEFPNAVEDDYVNVYQTALTSSQYNSWMLVGGDVGVGTWTNQDELINEQVTSNTLTYRETFKATTLSNDDFNMGTPTEQALVFNQIYSELAELQSLISALTGGAVSFMEIDEYDSEATATKSVKTARNIVSFDGSSEIDTSSDSMTLSSPVITATGLTDINNYSKIEIDGDNLSIENKNSIDGDSSIDLLYGEVQIIAPNAVTVTGEVKAPKVTIGTREITDNTDEETLNIKLNENVTMQLGQEEYLHGINNTGLTITNGQVCYLMGADGTKPQIALASNVERITAHNTLGIATEQIAPGAEGFVTVRGLVRGLNTSTFTQGDILYLSTNGTLSTSIQQPPLYNVIVGTVVVVGTIDGVIYVSPQLDDQYADRALMNGQFRESFDALYNQATSEIDLTNADGVTDYLTMFFSDGELQLDTTALSIAPTFGTDTSPQKNFIYIPIETKAVTVSTTGWPLTEHIRIAFFLLFSETYSNSEGALINQNWNNHTSGTDNMGALQHIRARLRKFGATYESGIAGTGTDGWIEDVAGTLYYKASAGIVWQLHPQVVMAKDTSAGDDMHLVNQLATPYEVISTFNEILLDSTGTALGNTYWNVVLFGLVNKTNQYSPILINLPAGTYANQTDAEQDIDNFAIYTLPDLITKDAGVTFPIARLTFYKTGSTIEYVSAVDLRTTTSILGGGGSASTGNEFIDTTFEIQANTDTSKILQFSASGITSGATRTATMPDKDITMADEADLVLVEDRVTVIEDELTSSESTQSNSAVIASTKDIIAPVDGGAPRIPTIYGLSPRQLVENGDFATTDLSWWTTSGATVIDNEVNLVSAIGGNTFLVNNILDTSTKYFVSFDITDITSGTPRLSFGGITVEYTTVGRKTYVGTPTTSTFNISRTNSAVENNFTIDNIMLIPITNTSYSGDTVAQLNTRFLTYFEGQEDLVNPELKFTGKNLLDENDIEQGDKNVTTGADVVSTTRVRNANFISVINGEDYAYSLSDTLYNVVAVLHYNKDGSYIGYDVLLNNTGTFDAQGDYVKFTFGLDSGLDLTPEDLISNNDIQVEQGTTATTYTAYASPSDNFKVYGTAREVGDVRDTFEYVVDHYELVQRIGYDYNDVVQSATSWGGPAAVLTNTHVFLKDLTSLIDYKVPSTSLILPSISFKIGDVVFDTVTNSDVSANDIENQISINPTSSLVIRVNKTTYPDSASFETYLQANDVEFRYELDTPLDGVAVDQDGSTYQEEVTTIEQIADFGTDYDVVFALNISKQREIDTANIQSNKKEITANEAAIEAHDVRLTDIETKTDNISVTQAVDLDIMESDILSAKTKTDFVTVTEAVDLDKVGEVTEILSTKIDVSNSTGVTPDNITLSESIANFDYIKVLITNASTGAKHIRDLQFSTTGDTAKVSFIDILNGTTGKTEYQFTIKRLTDTTMSAYYGQVLVTTYGASAGIIPTASSVIDINKIYGVKL